MMNMFSFHFSYRYLCLGISNFSTSAHSNDVLAYFAPFVSLFLFMNASMKSTAWTCFAFLARSPVNLLKFRNFC